MATLNRKEEVIEFLESLAGQTYKDFELIIVDQNDDDKLEKVVAHYQKIMNIIYVRSEIKGLSHARNVGIKYATGEIIAFPDDDCKYPEDLLNQVKEIFLRYKPDVITIKQKDNLGNELPRRYSKKEKKINKWTVWTHVTSIRLFFRKHVINEVGLFDEELGLGEATKWKSGEDIDFPIRVLKKGFSILFVPSLYVIHNIKENDKKVYEYSLSSGYIMRKHGYSKFFC